jgi:hypothetical protein
MIWIKDGIAYDEFPLAWPVTIDDPDYMNKVQFTVTNIIPTPLKRKRSLALFLKSFCEYKSTKQGGPENDKTKHGIQKS